LLFFLACYAISIFNEYLYDYQIMVLFNGLNIIQYSILAIFNGLNIIQYSILAIFNGLNIIQYSILAPTVLCNMVGASM